MPMGTSQALSRKLVSPRGEDDASRSASPSASPRQRQRRLPGGLVIPDSPQGAPREAWGTEGGFPESPRQGHDQRGSGSGSRPATTGKARRGGSAPLPPQMSTDWHATTLFGGDKCTNHKAKRAYATTFRRPTSSRAPAHTRPIFVVGPDGLDPKVCVDINAPGRFGSFERTRYEAAWRQAKVAAKSDEGGRALPEPSSRSGGNRFGNSGSLSSSRGCPSFADGRSGTPMRPQSVNSVGYRGAAGPSPMPGQRPLALSRPVSQQHASRPPPAPAIWSGA